MKQILLVIILIGLFSTPTKTVFAQSETDQQNTRAENYFGLPLCLPGTPADGTCLMYGPAQTVAKMKETGIPYPLRDLPAASPPAEMGVMPVFIAKINLPEEQPAPVYSTFDDAVQGGNVMYTIEAGRLRYVSYISRRDHNGKPYLQLKSGGWVRAAPIAYTDFQGLEFFENPRNDFGWIIYDYTETYREPSFLTETTDQTYLKGDLIQVYKSVESDGTTWHQIGADEWVHGQRAAVISLNTNPPEGKEINRWVEINLHQQTMVIYENEQMVFATVLASGIDPFFTKPGVFEIYEMKPLETMRGSFEADRSDYYYLEDVPWTIYYDQSRALHSTYWPFAYGTPQSHGCLNLSPGDANWLYQWAELGDTVWVHDPSGQTPTDESLYGAGAP